ncbi:MAG: hypothetical protein SF187_18635 [Deltaproteobacteria bacterium]|nr:hypothetical protein [Deltaproteobacteria bacterium]
MHNFCARTLPVWVCLGGAIISARAQAQEATEDQETPEAPAAGAPTPAPADKDSVGLSPQTPQYGQEADEARPAPASATIGGDGFKLDFQGYMRAPMRIGVGPRNDGMPGNELHSPPRIPDGTFTNWNYLNNTPGPWAEMMFGYGNSRATMTVSIASFNQTVAGYRELQAQQGINQAFVTVRFPDTFGRYGGLVANVGSFTNRYGTAGKYGAGMYQTYLFGRTRVAGETLTATFNLTPNHDLVLEHGIGAKLDVIPFVKVDPRPEYLPYEGPEPQGSTFLHHAHVLWTWRKTLTLGGHYLRSWSPDDRQLAGVASAPGSMTVKGGEVRLNGGVVGDGYLGFSRVEANNVRVLSDAIEVLHSFGGWQFKNNFFGRFDPRTGTAVRDESGRVDTLLFQHSVSIGKIARYPARFWGRGPDLVATVFGMYNRVQSDNNSHTKLKVGADLLYTPLPWLGVGGRYDLVRPDSRDAEESFSVLSPRLQFRTQFLAHERITVQYSRYFLGSKAYPAFPYETSNAADPDVFMIVASMWW